MFTSSYWIWSSDSICSWGIVPCPPLKISLEVRTIRLSFLSIVLCVTGFIIIFSAFYMEGYNIKKYYLLIVFFLVSILTLSARESALIVFIFWDFLGVRSIFLIIFYPNKNNLSRSLWTMYYNRLGDFFMLLIVVSCFLNQEPLFRAHNRYALYWLILVCIFTKRAIYPASTWLPLAMAAPTPISAIVHSSTLVTAGTLVASKRCDFMPLGERGLILVICLCGYISGGFIACQETDLKKIIAFSTMSQIRLITFLVVNDMKILGFTHMIMHAFFKRCLFISAGSLFMWSYSDQLFCKRAEKFSQLNRFRMLFCLIRMSGIPLSISFYTKDLGVEMLVRESGSACGSLGLILGGAFTIFYRIGLSNRVTNRNTRNKSSYLKDTSGPGGFYFTAIILIISRSLWLSFASGVVRSEFTGRLSAVVLSLIMIRIKKTIISSSLPGRVFFIKQILGWKWKLTSPIFPLTYTDSIVFKKSNMWS